LIEIMPGASAARVGNVLKYARDIGGKNPGSELAAIARQRKEHGEERFHLHAVGVGDPPAA